MEELESNLETARARAARKAERERKAAEKAAREKGETLAVAEAPGEEVSSEETAAAETPVWPPVAETAPELATPDVAEESVPAE